MRTQANARRACRVFLLWYDSFSSSSLYVPASRRALEAPDCSPMEMGGDYLSSEPTGRAFPRPAG